MPFVYIYIRVSTDKQSLSPEFQRQTCRHYYESALKPRGYEMGGFFEDIGQSAFNIPWAEREAGRELFRALKPGDAILVAKQDRAWRSVRDRENSLFFLKNMNINLVVLDSQIDTTTAAGKFAAGIIALQSQWESEVRSERVKAAHAIRKQRKKPSTCNPPPGWKYDKDNGELVPDYRERTLLELIYKWRATRVRSIAKTCRWLREEGIHRVSGAKYNVQWVQRAWMCRQKNWPAEGYVQTFWRDASVPAEERDKYRLPKIDGKQHVNFHPGRLCRVNNSDLRWLSKAYLNDEAVSFEIRAALPHRGAEGGKAITNTSGSEDTD